MRRYVTALACGLTLVASLLGATGAQAVVVNMNAVGQTSVSYSPSDQSGYFGVALAPGTGGLLAKAKIPVVKSTAPSTACSNPDPWLALDLGTLPSSGLCWHGGPVINANETLALTWDPGRKYWATTRNYVERFLRDAADGSNTLTSPYAVTTQYRDSTAGHAFNRSVYGGGCIDFGALGGSACKLGSTDATGTGHDYHDPGKNNCPNGSTSGAVTDADISCEVANMVAQTSLNDPSHTQPGYRLTVVLLMPPGVQVCLDSAHTLCSVTSTALPQTAQFCSYHSHIKLPNGTDVPYVVQPWTAHTACDEPGLPQNLDPAIDAGIRLVNPLSQGHIAAIVNPFLNGWFGSPQGSEINDNSCVPGGYPADKVTVGNSAQNPYYLQPEFNNAGALESDPNAPACALGVALAPTFVVPSPIDQGNVVAFDGSVTVSTLMVPKDNYRWQFGDGLSSTGPSVEHLYAKGGTYTVTLSVTDRGGNQSTISQTIVVLGPDGKPVTPPAAAGPRLHAHLQLMPQGLRRMLRFGLAARVSSNEVADGIATMSISARDATRAHIRHGRLATVVIARGTVSQIRSGTVALNLHLSPATAGQLRRLRHVTLTLRLSLVAADDDRLTIVAAGRY